MDTHVKPSTNASTIYYDNDVIPSTHPARTLVLCFDGTGDSFDADNSNVVLFFSMLKKHDRTQQMVYYQAGIGTYTTPEIATPVMAKLSKTLDMMIAWNLDAHVMDGYEFLMENYSAGDKICIFGFSRGAYTARALAGMIHKVGLLPSCNRQQVPFAYKMYTRTDNTGWAQSTAFKKAFSMDVDIEFIGVWDTVNSVGVIPRRLPFTASNSSIRTFRHAISLDEHRAKFKANVYNQLTAKEAKLGTKKGEMPKARLDGEKHTQHHGHNKLRTHEREFDAREETILETDVLEVWFAGCHTDVGGGSVLNSSRHNLARIPLRWMIRQCFLANTGIRFHGKLLHTIGLDPATLYPDVKPRPPALFHSLTSTASSAAETLKGTNKLKDTARTLVSPADTCSPDASSVALGYNNVQPESIGLLSEEEEDLADALCRSYDQLRLAPWWWILEVLPMKQRAQREDNNEWVRNLTINLGRPRVIPRQKRQGVNVHRSVKVRMEAGDRVEGGKYGPRAEWKVEPNWVD
ncbi:hypothetical protein JB92DRAFT_3114279 [Gautieria morchelliformis]|nr:hypothetical protein JB92DRAFT_3114279 [Gautieria morchelliformis]